MTRVGLLGVHLDGDDLDLYRALLGPHDVEVIEFRCDEGELPASLGDCDGWLCSVWSVDLTELVGRIVAEERAFVGICGGHQLLAHSLGATVGRAEHGWCVGVQDYDIVAHPWWADPHRDRVSLIANHQEQVTSLPPGTALLARNDSCPVAGLLVGERAWSLQGHPELTWELADSVLAGRVDLLGESVVVQARASLAHPTDQHVVGTWMARFFKGTAGGPSA